ncbi:hypothetical protein C1645_831614 [Glomus cerebriforme]|uniref:Uncharacterized protein n=1 Tax=Glomus cerebriforme TaxID=658196 RepID=A0A397SF91_9GLOM|nr:hypothetical protein C1645_831614 [Glomus cerebriforme]
MSSLLSLIVRLSWPASRIFRSVAFFSSTSTLSDKYLINSRKLVKKMLREKGLPIINTMASNFRKEDLKALKVNFKPVKCNNQIIPKVDVKDLLPEQYILSNIHFTDLEKQSFDVRKIDVSDDVRTFILKLHWVVKNSLRKKGTDETFTNTLVDDLLRIVGFNTFPLVIRNHQECRMFIGGYPYLTADPEYSIKMIDTTIIAVEDKHLENVDRYIGYGECQVAAEMLTCASDNLRQINLTTNQIMKQTIYAIRVISSYVTFYKVVIPPSYFEELTEGGLPQEQSVEILRWPEENILKAGLNIAEPEGRYEVLEILVRIRKHLVEKENQVY